MSCASIGNRQYLINNCHRLHIISAEFQHGMINSKMQFPYNYGASFFDNEKLKNLLPQYILTFGKSSSDMMCTPSRKVEIGSPYPLQKALVKTETKSSNLNILVISDPNSPDIFSSLIEEFIGLFHTPCNIIYKLHPVEGHLPKERYANLLKYKNVTIKTYESIYLFHSWANIVISGGSSTAIYEALLFNHRPYIHINADVLSNDIDLSIFNTFTTADELIALINQGNRNTINQEQLAYIWQQNHKECYERFVQSILNGKNAEIP